MNQKRTEAFARKEQCKDHENLKKKEENESTKPRPSVP